MVGFGKYLLSEERTDLIQSMHSEEDTVSLQERLREVYHADFENWKEKTNIENVERNTLEDFNNMCISSLSTEAFEKWEEVKNELISNRSSLKQ